MRMRTQVYISHSTKLIYYILTHLSRSLFLTDGQNQTNVTWAQRASGSAKKAAFNYVSGDLHPRDHVLPQIEILRTILLKVFAEREMSFMLT